MTWSKVIVQLPVSDKTRFFFLRLSACGCQSIRADFGKPECLESGLPARRGAQASGAKSG
jgi:hypothetical protein